MSDSDSHSSLDISNVPEENRDQVVNIIQKAKKIAPFYPVFY